MKMIFIQDQDTLKSTDTTKIIKASKLIPAKIESTDGAIIPKEAIEWTELQPSIRVKEEKSDFNQNYIWFVVGLLLILGFAVYFFKKRKKKSV